MDKQRKLPVVKLHHLLSEQVNESIARVDARQGEQMERYVAGQELSLSLAKEQSEELTATFEAFKDEMLEQADARACAAILEAYGTYGR